MTHSLEQTINMEAFEIRDTINYVTGQVSGVVLQTRRQLLSQSPGESEDWVWAPGNYTYCTTNSSPIETEVKFNNRRLP